MQMQFTLDALPERAWPVEYFGPTWNGWAAPVVTREVLADVLTASGEPHRWEDDVAWLGTPAADLRAGEEPEYYDPVRPGEDGTYDLGQMGWCFVEVPKPSTLRPNGAAYDARLDFGTLGELVPDSRGFGPLWVAWDTNVLSLFETYGAAALDLELGSPSWERVSVQSQHSRDEVEALLDIVTMWLGHDLRFLVLAATDGDAKKPLPDGVRERRARAVDAVSAALEIGLDGEGGEATPRSRQLPRAVLESLPAGRDRLLVSDAYIGGAHVFLTMDKGILRRDSEIEPWGMRCLSPVGLRDRLKMAGLPTGFYLDYLFGGGPDLMRLSALLGAFDLADG